MKGIERYVLQPARFKLDGGAMFGIIPRPLWSRVAAPDEANRIDLSLRLYAICVGDKLIVVDTGIGDYHPEKFQEQFAIQGPARPLCASLKKIGKTAHDVTDLVLSHLHFDHVGGIGQRSHEGTLEAVFPKATLHLHQGHYTYSQNPTEKDSGSFRPPDYAPVVDYYRQAGKLHLLTGDEGVVLNEGSYELRFRVTHGHTPYLCHPYDDQFIYLADIIPTSNHIHVPWVMGYDISPGITVAEKRELLQWCMDKKLRVIFEHDPVYWGASIAYDAAKNQFRAGEKFPADPNALALSLA